MHDELDAETRRKVDELEDAINALFANKTLNIIMLTLLELTVFALVHMPDPDKQLDNYVQMLKLNVAANADPANPFPKIQ